MYAVNVVAGIVLGAGVTVITAHLISRKSGDFAASSRRFTGKG
tara:strand:- start:1059 stop:1187 length:129 start_codon:yes stop_codon:yes gene_type:complete